LRTWRRRLVGLGLIVALAALLYAFHPSLLRLAARALDVSEPPRRVDCVLVLGGGEETRPFAAVALVNAGLAREVLVPSGPRPADDDMPARHEIIRRALVARGVAPEAVVVLPDVVDSTADEARALGRFLESRPECSVAVVTNRFHTRRARAIFRRELGERAARVHFVGVPRDGYDETDWWQCEEGFGCYLNEYAKLAFHSLR
jgi:uncharacterized SAM-binding protein YcdF (DUF218 family)